VIDFSSSADFTMSRGGHSLFYVDSSNYLCKYDVLDNRVTRSSNTYTANTKLFVDETGDLYANSNGTFYTIATDSLTGTVNGSMSLNADNQFSVYKNVATYLDSATGNLLQTNLTTNTTTTLQTTSANLTAVFANPMHTVAASGNYIAGTVAANQFALYNTSTAAYSTFTLPAGGTLGQLKFSEEGDRVYYLDSFDNTINAVDVDSQGNLAASSSVMVQGGAHALQGLSVTGSMASSAHEYIVNAQSMSFLNFDGADTRLYQLGLATTKIDTVANASSALGDLLQAMNNIATIQVRVGATMNILERRLSTNQTAITYLENYDNILREPDVAAESIKMSRAQIINEFAAAMIAHDNTNSAKVLSLFNN
jgi:flagellin-like hook-associated protein FlgL